MRLRPLGGLTVLVLLGVACGPSVAKLQPDPPELTVHGSAGASIAVRAVDAAGQVIPNAGIRWHSSAPQVATVEEQRVDRRPDGALLYHVNVGQSGIASLTAKAGKASIDVRAVVEIPKSIGVDPPFVRLMALGQTQLLKVSIRDEDSKPIDGAPVWVRVVETGAKSPVSSTKVTDGGILVTAVGLGREGLMVVSGPTSPADAGADPPGSFRMLVPVEVAPATSPQPPSAPSPTLTRAAAFAITPATVTLRVGQSVLLRALSDGAAAKGGVFWKSSNPRVLVVNSKGKAKARKRGKAQAIATLNGKGEAAASIVIR